MNEDFNMGKIFHPARDINSLKYQEIGAKNPVLIDLNTGKVETGIKNDQGKLRYDLVPYNAFREVVKVLTFGASKYDEENWRKVPEWRKRYFAAAMRHILDGWKAGEQNDPESKTHHLSNAITCLMFILEKELTGEE